MRINLLQSFLFVIAGLTFNHGICQQSELQKKHDQLSKDQPYALFDLGLTSYEIDILESLIINEPIDDKPIVLNYYGDLEQFESQVSDFLQSFGNSEDDSFVAAQIIYKIVKNCCEQMGVDEAWIAIRAFKKNHAYDIARWHIDSERLYTPQRGAILYKIACAFKGDSTIFCDVSDKVRTKYLTMRSQSYVKIKGTREQAAALIRGDIAKLLRSHKVISASRGQGAIFIMGDEKTGAIHSEPVMDKDRIFMSIIPGTHEQIQDLYKNWHQVIANRFKQN